MWSIELVSNHWSPGWSGLNWNVWARLEILKGPRYYLSTPLISLLSRPDGEAGRTAALATLVMYGRRLQPHPLPLYLPPRRQTHSAGKMRDVIDHWGYLHQGIQLLLPERKAPRMKQNHGKEPYLNRPKLGLQTKKSSATIWHNRRGGPEQLYRGQNRSGVKCMETHCTWREPICIHTYQRSVPSLGA